MAKHRDEDLPTLIGLLAKDCLRRAKFSVYDRCQARFEKMKGV
jgi:hypothetical protein